MKHIYLLFVAIFAIQTAQSQIIDIPDANFKDALVNDSSAHLIGDVLWVDVDTNDDGEIQVSEAEAVTHLFILSKNIDSIEGIEFFTNLEYINCSGNNLTTLDLSSLQNLNFINCQGNSISQLNINGLSNLTELNCALNELTSINLSSLTSLQDLKCQENQLTSLDVNSLNNLQYLNCQNNELTSLDIDGLNYLDYISCRENPLLSSLNLNALSSLTYLDCSYGNLTSLDLSSNLNLVNLLCDFNEISSLNVTNLSDLQNINCRNNQLTGLNLNGLSSLTQLRINFNQLSTLNIDGSTSLERIYCSFNQLTNLDLSAVSNLTILECSDNQLTNLNLLGLINLTSIQCQYNQLINLTVSGSTSLGSIRCDNNQLSDLDLTGLSNLASIQCNNNQLTSLDLSGLNNLSNINCSNNQLTTLNTTDQENIISINCSNNQLITLFIKDGQSGGSWEDYNYIFPTHHLSIGNNPNMEYVCVDDFGYEGSQAASQLGSNAVVGSYCSFVPGGTYYTIQGRNRIDNDNDGCDVADASIPFLKYTIENGWGYQTGTFISNALGNYNFPVQAGTHTIFPIIENPDYFTVSPTSITVDFPTDTSPFMQDFCITPIGSYNDLEITIIPLETGRPGFDTDYKLLYTNNGNTTQSGAISLAFQGELMDLVSVTPNADIETSDNLTWNYTNLLPLESREIIVTLNLNAPTETPPLNGGDTLNFVATINPVIGDETIEDNTFELSQTVVNSYDPNDKTCLEGNTVEPDIIGKDVHYLIRFENTGTANAINVVVKDIIDTSKFDVSSLFLTDSSHDLVTRITNTNVVEFIFENINLPFDDANNDGYIAFKLKTLPTLVAGDTFENDAEIYFDYNFPIDTNIAQTTIESTLSTNNFELSGLEIYPNPVQEKLHINGINSIQSVTILDISGRLINQVSYLGTHNNIEVSIEKLTQGTYFVKVKTDVGEFVKKVVKE